MLVITHVKYLFNNFLIQRLLEKRGDVPGARAKVVQISEDVLVAILKLAEHRLVYLQLHRDFSWLVSRIALCRI